MTAIDAGASSRAVDAASAWCSRLADRRDRRHGRLDREPHAHGSVDEAALRDPARVREHVQHPHVVRQRVGAERRDAVRARDHGEVLEQQRAEPPALLVVLHDERDLGFVGARRGRNARPRPSRRRGARRVPCDCRSRLRSAVRVAPRSGGEPARRNAGTAISSESRSYRPVSASIIVGPDRTDTHGAAVGEHDVALPLGWVLGHVGHLIWHDLACTS